MSILSQSQSELAPQEPEQLLLGEQQTSNDEAQQKQRVFFDGDFSKDDVLIPDNSKFYYEDEGVPQIVDLPRMGYSNRSFEGQYGLVTINGFSANLLGVMKYQESKHGHKDVNRFDLPAIDSITKFINLAGKINGSVVGFLMYNYKGEEQSVECTLSVETRRIDDETQTVKNVIVTISPYTKTMVTEEVDEFFKNFSF